MNCFHDFTIVIPIKGTDEEMKFIERSIHSAYKIMPGELLLVMDEPANAFVLAKLDEISQNWRGQKPTTKRMFVEKDPEWNFQLAKIIWKAYRMAHYDLIYSFDIDSLVRKDILKGIKHFDDKDMALVSFTKRLHISSIQELIRFIMYRIRVRTNDSVFSGNYWVNKQKFFEIVDKNEYMELRNGVDTFLTEKIRKSKFKMINRKEMGVKALSKQNEDYDWRQFMDGLWLFANREKIKSGIIKRGLLRQGFVRKHPKLSVLIKSMAYQRWGMLRGYNWGKSNPDSEQVRIASTMDHYDWGYTGNKYLPKLKFKDKGTGFHE